ncbi:MAG: hypothetical protein V5A38_02980 [Halolamina sp.]|uniref:DUF7475 family protein n=1 Tax=Halolamina sp. TaxID=1940283 RepID=UPI002FC3CFE2
MSTVTDTAESGLTVSTDELTRLHWVGIALAAVTGILHLVLAAALVPGGLGIAFIVAGVGFLGGIAAILVDYRRQEFILLGIPFTLGQIVAWYVANAPDFSPLGIGDKVVQAVLIVALVMLYRQD